MRKVKFDLKTIIFPKFIDFILAGIRDNKIQLIWLLAIIWGIGGELGWSHWPISVRHDDLRLTFNSMMEHMRHWQFDVDPKIVGDEGFLRNNKVFAYWGIFPAFLRLPFLVFPQGEYLDMTRLSCLLALMLMLYFNYKSWKLVCWNEAYKNNEITLLFALVLAFSGAQVCFFAKYLYQEVCTWSLAWAACFIYWVLKFLIEREDVQKYFTAMSIAAGLALLTRITMGMGLYIVVGCLVVFYIANEVFFKKQKGILFVLKDVYKAVFVLVILASVMGYVNYMRWGSPFIVADFKYYIFNMKFPLRGCIEAQYGLFNVSRIPLGIIYYFFPVWIFLKSNGHFFFEKEFSAMIDPAELPPSSFFLTDGYMIFSIVLFVKECIKKHFSILYDIKYLIGIVVGLLVPPLLMLMALSMDYRYRAEFYPLMIMGAFLSFPYICNIKKVSIVRSLYVLGGISILSSNFIVFLYSKSDLGASYDFIKKGVFLYYLHKL